MSSKLIYGAIIGFIAIWIIPVVQANEEFQSSYTCIECHPDRYEEWTRSTHALAVSDPVFEASYMRALKSDPQYREYCLSCHSPITRASKDFNLTKSISIEGVGCTFCHSVTGVEKNNYIFNQSNPMQVHIQTQRQRRIHLHILTYSQNPSSVPDVMSSQLTMYQFMKHTLSGRKVPMRLRESNVRTATWRLNAAKQQKTEQYGRRFTSISGMGDIQGCSWRRRLI